MDALRQKMGLIWRREIKLETQKEPNQTLTRTFCVCFGILWCFLVLPTFWFVRKQAKLNTGNSMEFFRGPEKRPQQNAQIPTNWQPAQRHAKWPKNELKLFYNIFMFLAICLICLDLRFQVSLLLFLFLFLSIIYARVELNCRRKNQMKPLKKFWPKIKRHMLRNATSNQKLNRPRRCPNNKQ